MTEPKRRNDNDDQRDRLASRADDTERPQGDPLREPASRGLTARERQEKWPVG